ncbi:unnamed protein product [Effrenium voratum]|nr:unnamed protein product [Effrenium voratum]
MAFASGPLPGLRLLQLPDKAACAALREARRALAERSMLELGVGFAALRALRKLRARSSPRTARKVWAVQQRGFDLRRLDEFPACHAAIHSATQLFGLSEPRGQLNVILRSYAPGEWLGRHVDDVRMFAEPVLAAILSPGSPRDGLLFTLPAGSGLAAARRDAEAAGSGPMLGAEALPLSRYQVPETAGTLICLQREARFLYGHEVPSAPVIFRGRCYGAQVIAERGGMGARGAIRATIQTMFAHAEGCSYPDYEDAADH